MLEYLGQIPYLLGAFQGLLLSIFLFTIRVNKLPNLFLGLLTFCWAVILLQFPLQDYGLYSTYPHLLKTFSLLLFVLFPLLYLNIKYLLSDFSSFDKKDLFHFSFVILFILLYLPFYIMSPEEKLELVRNKTQYYKVIQIVGDEIIAIQGVLYSLLSLRLINKYKNEVENYQSTIEGKLLKALKGGTVLIFIAWIIGSIAVNLNVFHVAIDYDLFNIVYLIIVVVIYYISYVAIYTPEVFKVDRQLMDYLPKTNDNKIEQEIINADFNNESENKSREEEKKILEDYIQLNEPYLLPELSLIYLAEELGFSRHQLSELINQAYGVNFYEFINSYRVEKVKELMKMPENSNLKIISIAYDSGFNSKSSFNRIFKQMTGQTPGQYAKSIE